MAIRAVINLDRRDLGDCTYSPLFNVPIFGIAEYFDRIHLLFNC